ncbi:MAG: ThiF family adenylyltransferase [Chitinophagaceae bacterium]|nr:ThiF family adenylyltransferase [Chitinophagaceae bacterium]
MTKSQYQRNKFYVSDTEQEQISNYKILLAGCGIGSNIAECALRLGFEKQTLIDGDTVDESNLNRQNYASHDVQYSKAASLRRRLLLINKEAEIEAQNLFLDRENINEMLPGHNVAINALDFQSDIPFQFDELCQGLRIPVLHPYNIGWGTMVFVIMPDGKNLSFLSSDYVGFEKKVASFLIDNISGPAKYWIRNVLQEYEKNGKGQSPPQLSVGSWLAAGACSDIMYRLATGRHVRAFPDFYFLTTNQ